MTDMQKLFGGNRGLKSISNPTVLIKIMSAGKENIKKCLKCET